MEKLNGKKIALLVANGFEQSELAEPKKAIEKAGGVAHIVSPEEKQVRGWKEKDWGDTFSVDVHLDKADVSDYDGLVLPGGQINPDLLRANEQAIRFIRSFVASGKPVAAICHGPWTLVEAEVVDGRRMTSYHSIKTDLKNAGAEWVDEACVTDGNLITSRKPEDLPEFIKALISAVADGVRRLGVSQRGEPRPEARGNNGHSVTPRG